MIRSCNEENELNNENAVNKDGCNRDMRRQVISCQRELTITQTKQDGQNYNSSSAISTITSNTNSNSISNNQQQQQSHQHQPHQQQQQQQLLLNVNQQHDDDKQSDINNRSKRNPYCSRCRNHGKSAQVKGHKRHCEYRDCQCEGCKLVECRQIVSAAQIKRRRYQKQDEECGRRIEISPPVLTRAPNSDPATLIAKTLINSTKHSGGGSSAAAVKQHLTSSTGCPATGTDSPVGQAQQIQMIGSIPAFHSTAAASLAAAVAASSAPSSFPPTGSASAGMTIATSNGQHVLRHPQVNMAHLNATCTPTTTTIGLSPMMRLSNQQQPPGPVVTSMSQLQAPTFNGSVCPPTPFLSAGPTDSPNNYARLSEAFHLFHYPNSIPTTASSAAAAAAAAAAVYGHQQQHNQQQQQHQHQHQNHHLSPALMASTQTAMANQLLATANAGRSVGSSGAQVAVQSSASLMCPAYLSAPSSSSSASSSSLSSSLPVMREQLALVEDIHRAFGPLAVYAWLRTEHFNVAKVRTLIDLAKVSFDELLQINGHSPLDLTSPIVD